MKKTYIKPEVKAYKMVVSQMIMTSTTSVDLSNTDVTDEYEIY